MGTVIRTIAWLLFLLVMGCIRPLRREGPFLTTRSLRTGWWMFLMRWRCHALGPARATLMRGIWGSHVLRRARIGGPGVALLGRSHVTRLGGPHGTMPHGTIASGFVVPFCVLAGLLGTAESQALFSLSFVGRPFHSR